MPQLIDMRRCMQELFSASIQIIQAAALSLIYLLYGKVGNMHNAFIKAHKCCWFIVYSTETPEASVLGSASECY